MSKFTGDKKQIFDALIDEYHCEQLAIDLCNCFDTNILREFIQFIQDESN